jgi:hypothetical protein
MFGEHPKDGAVMSKSLEAADLNLDQTIYASDFLELHKGKRQSRLEIYNLAADQPCSQPNRKLSALATLPRAIAFIFVGSLL